MADKRWFKYCKAESQKQEVKAYLAASSGIFDILRKILEEELDASIKDSGDKSKYELPSWAEFQADSIGEQRTLRKIINLIKPDKG